MRHQRFFDVSQAKDLKSFDQKLLDFTLDMDFGLFAAALVIDRPKKKPAFVALGNIPADFQSSFDDQKDVLRDPVLKRLKTLSIPFHYTQETYVSEGAGDLWEAQAAFGYRTGIAVALHLPDHKHFLLGVDREKPLPKRDEVLTRMFADLQLLAVHAQDAALRLLRTPEEIRSLPPPTLTEREIEILKWTMDGKSAWATGEILSISEHTVNFHLRNVFRKLESSSKHQAVLKAMDLGLL